MTERVRFKSDLSNRSSLRFVALGDCNTRTNDQSQGTVTGGVVDALGRRQVDVRLANLGGGMWTTREGLARLRNHGQPCDIAIINYGLVDAWQTSIPHVYVPYYPAGRSQKIRRKILKFVKRRLRSNFWGDVVTSGSVVPLAEFEANIRSMIRMLRRRNPKTLIALWTTASVDDDDERNKHLADYNDGLRTMAETENAAFADSTEVLSDLSAAERFLDGVHLSPAAASLLGEAIVSQWTAGAVDRQMSSRRAA